MKNMSIFRHAFGPLTRGALFYLCLWGGMGLFIPFLNVYFRHELGFSGRQIGLLAMFLPFMTFAVSMPVSALADRKRWRVRLLTGVTSGFGAMLFLGVFPQRFFVWVILLVGIAFFFGPIVPLADSLIARMALRHNLNYGSMRLCGSLSFAMSAIVGGYIWERTEFRLMFLVAGLAFIPVAFFASRLEEGKGRPNQREPLSFRVITHDPGLLMLVMASFLIGASIHLSMMFDGIYMQSLGGTQTFIGLMFGLAALCEVPTMQYSMKITTYLSTPKTLLVGYALLATAFGGFLIAPAPWFLLIMAIIKGFGFGLFYVNTVRLANERTPEEWASTVQSILNSATFGLAPLFFAPFGGEVYDAFGVRSIYICIMVCLTSAVLIMTLSISKGFFIEKTPPIPWCAAK